MSFDFSLVHYLKKPRDYQICEIYNLGPQNARVRHLLCIPNAELVVKVTLHIEC